MATFVTLLTQNLHSLRHTIETMSMRQNVAGSACGGTLPFSRVRQIVAGACGALWVVGHPRAPLNVVHGLLFFVNRPCF